METSRMCGARLTDENELERHNQLIHPNMAGKKGGEGEVKVAEVKPERKRKEERDRPID